MNEALRAQHELHKARRARLGAVYANVVNRALVRKKPAPMLEPYTPPIQIPKVIQKPTDNQTPDELINSLAVQKYRTPLTVILLGVSKAINVDIRTMLSQDRRQEICEARFMLFWLCRTANYSLCAIGRKFGRDHTTVLNGVRKFEKHLREDGKYAAAARRLHTELITRRPAPYWGA